jgi:hypothetical protein
VNDIAGTFLPEVRDIGKIDKQLLIEKLLADREREDPSTGEKYQIPTNEIAAYVEEELDVKTTRTDVLRKQAVSQESSEETFQEVWKIAGHKNYNA